MAPHASYLVVLEAFGFVAGATIGQSIIFGLIHEITKNRAKAMKAEGKSRLSPLLGHFTGHFHKKITRERRSSRTRTSSSQR